MSTPKILLDSPCKAQGARFEARDEGRFCLSCQEIQYDLRDATRAEVIALIDRRGGRICGRLRTGPSGEPKFKPETPPRGLDVLRGAAVALALAACDAPSEATVSPEPTTAAPPASIAEAPPPPTTAVDEAPPPATAVGVDPPPDTTVAVADDRIDHSTDSSPNLADHQRHRHTHPIATIEPGSVGVGSLGGDHYGGYGGGLSISREGSGVGGN